MTSEIYVNFKLQRPYIKFYWDIAIPIRVRLSKAAFAVRPDPQSSVVGTETEWPAKPQIFTIWLLTKKNK